MIILMAGLPGTGKSTLARELAVRTGGSVLGKDEIRAAIFSEQDIEFSTAQDDFVMELMLQAARFLLERNPARKVFLDGRAFSRRYQIERVLEFTRELDQPWRIIECTCSEKCARHRLEDERDPAHPAKNRSYALYLEVKARFEPIRHATTVIDTGLPFEQSVDFAMLALD
ncbi:MAG TPA: AAA family ATPase [Terriglobales bacterium]|nr:AAA family ATPase [Terriglobales bacterium]